MQLTEALYKQIEDLGSLGYAPEKIALILGLDEDQFLVAFNDPGSAIRTHYERGSLIVQADLEKKTLRQARDGNITAAQQWKKNIDLQKLENYKRKLQFTAVRRDYESLQALVEKGEVRDLSTKQLQYFEQLDYIRSLYNKWESKEYIISMVMLKWPKISRHLATELFHESIAFFNADNDVKVEQWANVYADRFDQMGLLALEMGHIEDARRCFKDAAEMRGVGKEKPYQIPQELLDRRVVIYTINIKMFGLEPANRDKLAEFIDKLDVPTPEKHRIRRDAMIEDAVLVFDDLAVADHAQA